MMLVKDNASNTIFFISKYCIRLEYKLNNLISMYFPGNNSLIVDENFEEPNIYTSVQLQLAELKGAIAS